MCHTAVLPDGRVWLGAPATGLDIGRFIAEVDARWVAAGHPSHETALTLQKALDLGPGRFNAETADYPQLVGADFPPYFTLGQRTALNYLGTGKDVRSEAYLSIFTFGAGSPNAEEAAVPFPTHATLDPFLAFFGQFEPPEGPAQDPDQVAAGALVFEAAGCGACHHPQDVSKDGITARPKDDAVGELMPGADPAYPRGTVLTDKMHRVILEGDSGGSGEDEGFLDLIQFIFANGLKVGPSDGYRVNDLRGLWATAPYLHNGSVPTLDDLLKPAADRPATWMRGAFLFDTAKPGNGNGGHESGVELSPEDKQSLVAYLLSLH